MAPPRNQYPPRSLASVAPPPCSPCSVDHPYALCFDRGSPEHHPDDRRRVESPPAMALAAGVVFPGEPSVPTNLRRRIYSGGPRLRTPLGFIIGPLVGPWTRSTPPHQRAHARVVHHAYQKPPRGHLVNSRSQTANSRAHFFQKGPSVFSESTHSPF